MKPTTEQISKLPKWAQTHIGELQQRVVQLEGLPETIRLIEPDIPPPGYGGSGMPLTRGWSFNLYALKDRLRGIGQAVSKCCSSSVHNGDGWDRTSTQGPKFLYSTERKAWLAAKASFVHWAAEVVDEVDKHIAKASDKPYEP